MDVRITVEPESREGQEPAAGLLAGLLASEFSCHCCYEVLVDPTTLTCGHSFCRHCLATWWVSALPNLRTDCPECRATWQGFPRVNILLRDAVERLFPADVSRRKRAVRSDPWLCRVLLAFQQQGNRPVRRVAAPANPPQLNLREFWCGVLTALSCVAVVLLVSRTFSADSRHETLLRKPLSRWSADDVMLWVEHLGVWTNQYTETFRREQINGRSLSAVSDGNLTAAPFMMENQLHRRIILDELQKLKELRVTQPQTLWEYKERNEGKTLFLLISLRTLPRLTLLYLYLLDYDDTFLPFIHSVCPSNKPLQERPGWQQWAEFVLMFLLLPHQLLAAFAWHWLSVHCWVAGVVIVHTVLLTVLDVNFYWTTWRRGEMRLVPRTVCVLVLAVLMDSSVLVLFWPLVPLFIINCVFYLNLYFSLFLTAAVLIQTLQHTHTQHRP